LGTVADVAFGRPYALAINDSGVIAGNAYKSGNTSQPRAVRWNIGSTTAIELASLFVPPNPDFPTYTSAYAINSEGLIVGAALAKSFGTSHAVYWLPDGSIVALNSLIDPASGWTLTVASAISDTDWILGAGTFDPDGPGGQEQPIRDSS
jgi:uncharacterized membrane protein